jgi:hypothetical protein
MGLEPAGQFTAYKKKPLDHVRPKLSFKPHVFQSFTDSRCIAKFTAMRAVLSTTINRGSLIGVPHLIVSKASAGNGSVREAASARLVGRPMAGGQRAELNVRIYSAPAASPQTLDPGDEGLSAAEVAERRFPARIRVAVPPGDPARSGIR